MGGYIGRLKIVLLLCLSLLLLQSCSGQAAEEKGVCVAMWNVQNLFNNTLDGNEYTEYKPESGWGRSLYEKRLSNVRKVFHYLPQASAYVIVLNEIECSSVAEDIINSADIANMGLHWYACTEAPDLSIQTAVLSSLPIVSASVHDVGEGLRPILQVELESGSGKLFVLGVHFKSNLGGVEDTAADRLKAARVVSQVSSTLQRENPGCMVLVCGDMNEECWDDGCMGRGRFSSSPLRVSGEFEAGRWYCFWMDDTLTLWPNGSYLYEGQWKSYDNILASYSAGDGAGLELSAAGVVFQGILKTADSKPFSWNRQLLTGVSDHLPVWILLH